MLIDGVEIDGRWGRFNSPNDLVVGPDGALWFTDPHFGITVPQEGYPDDPDLDVTGIYRMPFGEPARLVGRLDQPNGLAFSPDGTVLYVSQTPSVEGGGIFSFAVRGDELGEPEPFARVPQGMPDGLTTDSRGWVWTSSGEGLWVFAPDGRRIGGVRMGHLTSNCTFDPDERRLFITGGPFAWALELPGA